MGEYLGPYLLGPNGENQGIYTGDARELAKAIPDESVDLIFTDPVYDRLEDYRWLAKTAARVLKPCGVVLVWSNGHWHRIHSNWLEDGGLAYRWDFAVVISHASAPMNGKIIAKTNRLLWFDIAQQSKMLGYLADGYLSIGARWPIPRVESGWGKSAWFTIHAVNAFCPLSGVVVDFFAGLGTTPAVCRQRHYHWLAFEIDSAKVKQARQRVWMTQPLLFVPEAEQLGLGIGC